MPWHTAHGKCLVKLVGLRVAVGGVGEVPVVRSGPGLMRGVNHLQALGMLDQIIGQRASMVAELHGIGRGVIGGQRDTLPACLQLTSFLGHAARTAHVVPHGGVEGQDAGAIAPCFTHVVAGSSIIDQWVSRTHARTPSSNRA